ncbi:hypothetical protein FACS1894178_2110 [Bacteroidia bacterium]|nr:hypothetical protein FACS1894178_2110 [Bacteroidia bacterium]
MKTLKIVSIVAVLFATQVLTAQNPAISKKYSDAEIATLLQNFRQANSHETIPTVNLQKKFNSDFPKAYDAEWETANNIYEVEFDVRFRDFKAYYDKDGNLLSVAENINPSELPAVVKNAAEAKYPKYHFEDIDKIRRGTETFYKIEMEHGESEVKIIIQSDGKILTEKFDY